MTEMNRRNLLSAGAAGAAVVTGVMAMADGALGAEGAGDDPTTPRSHQPNVIDFSNVKPTVVRSGGTVKFAKDTNFPVVVGNGGAAAQLVLAPGAMREPHWHPNAWEFDVPITGTGVLGVVNPDGTWTEHELGPGKIGFVPRGFGHYIESRGKEPLEWTLIFNNSSPDDIGLSTMFAGMPTRMFTETLGLPRGGMSKAKKPRETEWIVTPTPD